MPGACCKKGKGSNPGRKHTPITSEKQRGKFGAEYGRRKAGKEPQMKGVTNKELKAHLQEAKGKTLPAVSKKTARPQKTRKTRSA